VPYVESESEEKVRKARARKAELLRTERWLDTDEVASRQADVAHGSEALTLVQQLRRGNALLGVWSGAQYVHPSFQFSPHTGKLLPETKELIDLFPSRFTEWLQCLWCYEAHPALNHRTPAEVFPEEPHLVLALARQSFYTPELR
jgi:hypothetical protein